MSDRMGSGDWFALEGEEFVRQAYQRVLDRPADPTGLRSYVAQLQSGLSKADLVAELENSAEGRLVARRQSRLSGRGVAAPAARAASNAAGAGAGRAAAPAVARSVQELLQYQGEEFVRMAYLALLGRQVDPTGLQGYSRRLAEGVTREQVIADLHNDAEGQAYGAQLAGLPELLEQLAAAPEETQAATQVKDASELLTLHGEEFIRAAYFAILGRHVDREGLATYLQVLRNGFSRSHVLAALASSPEAQGRGASLPGLRQLLAGYAKGQGRGWSGWYWRNVKGVESDLPPAREARRMSWTLQKG